MGGSVTYEHSHCSRILLRDSARRALGLEHAALPGTADRQLCRTGSCSLPTAISVLIPARNEERVIAASLASLLASRGVEIEIVVLDDTSTDRTAEIVRSFAERCTRALAEFAAAAPRVERKQHACHALAQAARSDVLCFLDADVRLAPEALFSMSSFLSRSGSDLVSGFPRQETKTPLECLLLPLIHFVLLSYCHWPVCAPCRRRVLRQGAVSSLWCGAMPIERAAVTPRSAPRCMTVFFCRNFFAATVCARILRI